MTLIEILGWLALVLAGGYLALAAIVWRVRDAWEDWALAVVLTLTGVVLGLLWWLFR